MSSNPFDIISTGYSSTPKKKKNLFLEDNPFDNPIVPQSNNPFDTGRTMETVPTSQGIVQKPVPQTSAQGAGGKQFFDIMTDNSVSNFIGGVIKDVGETLSSGLYGVTKFFDSLGDKGHKVIEDIISAPTAPIQTSISFVKIIPDIPVAAKAGAIETGRNLGEVLNTVQDFGTEKPEQLSFKDLIKQQNPDFAKNYPISTSALGFVGDVALDPLTYVSFGTETGIRLAGKKLSNEGIDLLKELNSSANDAFRYTIRNKQGVERVGTIGIDELERLQNVQNLVGLGAGAKEGDQAALNQLSTILNANTKGFKGKLVSVEELTPAERNWTIESQFNNLVQQNPKLIMEGGDTGLFLNIPFSPNRITIIPPKAVDTILDKLGINKIRNTIGENLRNSDLAGMFSRSAPLEDYQNYVKLSKDLNGQKNIVDHSLINAVSDFAELNSDSRKKLADLAIRIDQKLTDKASMIDVAGQQVAQQDINAAQQALAAAKSATDKAAANQALLDAQSRYTIASTPKPLTANRIAQTRQFALNQALSNGEINHQEFEAMTKFVDAHNKLAQMELNSRLFNQVKDNITFFKPDILDSPVAKKGDLDIAVLRALQIQAIGYDAAMKDFDNGLKILFGQANEKGDLILTREMLPKVIKRDIDLIGYSQYSARALPYKNALLQGTAKFNNLFKLTAYGLRPAAAPKQFIANTLQSFATIGPSAFKNFDPRSLVDAALIISDNSAYRKYIPTWLMDGMQKFSTPVGKMVYAIDRFQPELAKEFGFVNRLGEKISGQNLVQELMQKDIYQKGLDILSLEQSQNLRLRIAKANGFSEFQKEKWHEGFKTFVKESIPWINLPNYVENMNKIATYINARKLGYLPDQAAELTKKALFDYAHGTTKFENDVMKRIIPFYTFQRFALPLVASLVKEPGRASNLVKITKEFFEVYNLAMSGQQLTDAQRSVLPGFLLEQPNVFNGYTKENGVTKGVFNTFNSYLFTDWLSLVHTNTDGSIDYPKTVQKMTLAQITPLLKVPIEWLAGKQFFTDLPFPNVDKKSVIASGGWVNTFEKNVPDFAKHLMGYETRTDPVTGEKKGYINPYLTYAMSSFAPFLTDYVNISKDDMNARTFAMKWLAGIGSVKLDFQKEQHYRIKEWQDKIKELQYNMRTAMLAGKSDVVSEKQAELQQIIQRMSSIANLNVQPPNQ